MKTMAVVGKVISCQNIEGFDKVHKCKVDCGSLGEWISVTNKNIVLDEKVVVLLPDALVPQDNPRFSFMERFGWRVRMNKFKGNPTECAVIKIENSEEKYEIGHDLTEELKVSKYEKPIDFTIRGNAIGNFPSWIKITDETNFQSFNEQQIISLVNKPIWYASEKADGTSSTCWNDDKLHVCGRTLEMADDGKSAYWYVAKKYNLNIIPVDYVLQYEIVGPKIQKNPMGLSDLEIRVFNLFHKRNKLGLNDLRLFTKEYNLPMVRVVAENMVINDIDSLRKLSEINYLNNTPGEGIVIRDYENTWSFKVINLNYKD